MTNASSATQARTQVFFMLLSAGIFAYFGFATTWIYTGVNGQFLLFVVLLDWTLKITAIAFGVSALLNWSAISRATATRDFRKASAASPVAPSMRRTPCATPPSLVTTNTAMSPVLLFIFAAWNGYGSWTGLQEALALRGSLASPRPSDAFIQPPN